MWAIVRLTILCSAFRTCICDSVILNDGERLTDEERLLDELFSGYNPSARPVLNSSDTVSVSIQFSLMHIKELDVISQIFTTTGLLILEWVDERLTWNPMDHNGMTEIMVEARGLWRPEFAVINGAEKIYEDYNQFRAVITHKGVVHWEPGGVFKTMCSIDITYYPFDEQQCVLLFGAWSYQTSKMNLTNLNDTINLDSYNKNGEWDIYSTPVERNEFAYDCCPNERFSNVAFNVYLRRRHTFYILNVILPSIMTSVLLLSIFFCTPGQKVQIGVVVLLSFRIFLLNVSDSIPKTSDYIPLLGIYLTCTMAITTLSMVLTVFVLNLHHISDRPIPKWARTFVLVYIARILGMCESPPKDILNDLKEFPKRQCPFNNGNMSKMVKGATISDDNEGAEEIQASYNSEPDSPWVRRDSFETMPLQAQNHQIINDNKDRCREINYIYSLDRECTMTTVNKTRFENDKTYYKRPDAKDYAKDWKRMAEIFDRLFFWLFLLAIVITTLVLFQPLTKSYFKQFTGEKIK